jgi:predicted transcriptional regulator
LLDDGLTENTVRGAVTRAAVVVYDDSSLRDAADQMARENVGRLPVVARGQPDQVIGIISRTDIIAAHARRLDGERLREPRYRLPRKRMISLLRGVTTR